MRGLLKDNGLIAVEQNAILHMPPDGARQNDLLDIPSLLHQVIDGVAVINPNHVLFDDGAIIEHLRNVVSGSADQLHAALEGLMVGLGSDERRQERMMNIDQIRRAQGGNEFVGEHLHVASEDDETALVLADERNLLLLGLALVFFCDRDNKVRNAIKISNPLVIRMV